MQLKQSLYENDVLTTHYAWNILPVRGTWYVILTWMKPENFLM